MTCREPNKAASANGAVASLFLAAACRRAVTALRRSGYVRTMLAIVAIGLLAGCSLPYGVRVNTARPLTDEEAHIIEIARQSLIAQRPPRQTIFAERIRVEFEVPRRRVEGGWSIVAWSLPKTPCAFWSILIDENDKVVPSE